MVECGICERRCRIEEGRYGYCNMYANHGGRLEARYPEHVSLLMVWRIESLPIFHFYPGSRTLVFATTGCNFDCHYCSSAYLARGRLEDVYMMRLEPGRLVKRARQTGCHNIAFSMNEPTVSLDYYLAVAEEARASGFPVGCLTNGYQTPETARRLAEASDFINVSVKGFDDNFYRSYADAESVAPVMRNVEFYHERTHLEVTTPIIAGLNDYHIGGLACWLGGIDTNIPWHVFRLLPEYKMADRGYPDIRQLAARLRDARVFLNHIYFGNFAGSQWLSTHCSGCGRRLIERVGLGGCGVKPILFDLEDDACPHCGRATGIVGDLVDWHSAETGEAV
ncbi:MAG: radical SAM protein [Actinomycetota bacterium]|nr:radical SAM protein [Actinomycetota bacterium]